MQKLSCKYRGVCGGCAWYELSSDHVTQKKLDSIRKIYPEAVIVYQGQTRIRDRADLVWQEVDGQMHLGMFKIDRESRSILDLESCETMTPELEAWLKDYRKRAPKIKKGSVRLRVSPSGQRGVWLDFSNQDVHLLFQEQTYLKWLSEQAVVEIGQRRKRLHWVDGLPKLKDAEADVWFQSYDYNGQPIPLFGMIGGFTQTGFLANKVLVTEIGKTVQDCGVSDWVELFGGSGNISLHLASLGFNIDMVEMDEQSLQGLEQSIRISKDRIRGVLNYRKSDVYIKSKEVVLDAQKGLIVDPPRAGLRELLSVIDQGPRPPHIVYVSCFQESLEHDIEWLQNAGYVIQSIKGIDQFPFSPHIEWIVRFDLINANGTL